MFVAHREFLAHADDVIAAPASTAPEGTAIEELDESLDSVAPCLIGATTDDRVAYELGTWFRPASYATVSVALVATILVAVLFRKFGHWRYTVLSAALGLLIVGGGMVAAHRQIPPTFEA